MLNSDGSNPVFGGAELYHLWLLHPWHSSGTMYSSIIYSSLSEPPLSTLQTCSRNSSFSTFTNDFRWCRVPDSLQLLICLVSSSHGILQLMCHVKSRQTQHNFPDSDKGILYIHTWFHCHNAAQYRLIAAWSVAWWTFVL